jgi:2-methylisocitrate lyase-like PEP mutase family enzyme
MRDFEAVGRAFRGTTLLSAALFESPGMPWPTPAELGSLGFTQVSYPATLVFRVTATIADTLERLRRHADGSAAMAPDAPADARTRLDDALQLARWQAIERGTTPADERRRAL